MIAVKSKAPSFQLRNQFGELVSLDTYRGKKVLLVFLPNILELRSRVQVVNYKYSLSQFHLLDTEVIGVCGSSMKDIQLECQNLQLNFPVLNDDACEVRCLYHAWKEKITCGNKGYVTQRSALLIDESGYVVKGYRQVNVNLHDRIVLAYLEDKRTSALWRSLSRRKKEKIMRELDNK